MAMTQEEVFSKVQEVLVDALGVDDDEVVDGAKLVADLGAESIDFLDIQFRLEKAFGVKIEQREMFPEDLLNDSEYVVDGMVTEKGLEMLRQRLPHADLTNFESDPNIDKFWDVFTVRAMVKFVQTKLAA